MKRIALIAIALASTSAVAAAPAKTKMPALPAGVTFLAKGTVIEGAPEVWKFRFPNGMRVFVLPDDRNPVATLRIKLDAGSDREKRGQTGLAHFFEHMMFRKTKFTEEGHYSKYLGAVGGVGNAGTSNDYVVYHSTFPGPALEKVMEMEAQRMMGLELVDPYFTTEKGAVVSERALNYDNAPSARGREFINAVVERGTPYEWLTIGVREDVVNMKIGDVQQFYRDFYTPDNSIVSVGGPFEVGEALRLVDKHFGKWNGKVTREREPLPKDYLLRNAGRKFICSEEVGEQTFAVYYPALENGYRSTLLASAVSELLDDHPEGKLERRLVKKKLATRFGFYKASWQRFRQPAVASFVLNKEQKFEDAHKAWLAALDEALKHPVDERFRKRLLKQKSVQEAEISLKMTDMVESYEHAEYLWGDFLIDRSDREIIKSLKQDEVRKWIRENLDPSKAYVTGIVPKGMAAPCSELANTK